MLVELNHKNKTEKNQELYITGIGSNVIKTTVERNQSIGRSINQK